MQISFQSSLQFYFAQFYKDIILMQLHHLFSNAAAVNTQSTDKLRDIAFIIADESNSIMNAKLPNLSVTYGSVY